MAKRGRPPGATSRWRNPNNFAAHHAQVLMEVWLAGAPVLEIRVMLSSLAGNPEQQALIEECWSKRGNERRYTVPPKIKRKLCRLAVAHVVELRRDAIQRRRAQAAQTSASDPRAGPMRRSPKSSAGGRPSTLISRRRTLKRYWRSSIGAHRRPRYGGKLHLENYANKFFLKLSYSASTSMHAPTYRKRGGIPCPWSTALAAIGKWRTRRSPIHPIRSRSFVPQSACRARCSTKPGQKAGVPTSTGSASRAALLTARA